MLAWLVPLLLLSGGAPRYLAVFGDTIGQAAAFEPLLSGFTLNRAATALQLVLLGPWGHPALGAVILSLSAAGFVSAALRRPAALGLALLAFAPYLVVHLLLQHVETLRYTLPYLRCSLSSRPRPSMPWRSARGPSRCRCVWAPPWPSRAGQRR
jgi:hypothetical protein